LDTLATAHGLPVVEGGLNYKFRQLLLGLANGSGKKVVVLIDEYDAPIVSYLGKDIHMAYANRDLLRSFYVVLKELDKHLQLVFLTGVSKFSKVGIFSGLNNLEDLSMALPYATMLGYTEAEMKTHFKEELAQTADVMGMTQEALLEKVRYWYNGYRFHAHAEAVYNPVSVNLFLRRQEFGNYWFATGTPTFLVN
ncbi:MAG: AAA family ATPase, partial [Saprospiraceae bacterium]|nr:AAA family ATPase [Saprospiraceae bacterium]